MRTETTYTPRFAGFVVLFGVLVAVGLVTFTPVALAAAALLVVFLLAGVTQTPTPPADQLVASYSVTPGHPRPADTVTVEVTVTNESQQTYPDVRLVDTVPENLEVVDGAPRRAATLRPGGSVTMEYDVIARRGEYAFGPVRARVRTLVGSMWVQQPLQTQTPATMRCAVRADDIPLEEQATHYIGELLSDVGGDGIEFHSTREYHRGDAPSRINWRELAKRQELSTITYRERQAADVTIITDARGPSQVSAGPGEPSGATLATYATYQLLSTLIERGHYVGVAIPGLQPSDTTTNSFPCRRIDHGRGDGQQRLAFDLFEEVDRLARANGPENDDSSADTAGGAVFGRRGNQVSENFVQDLTGWVSPNTQFVFVSTLLDDSGQELCQQLRQRGFPVVVISPDVTISPRSLSGSVSGNNDKSETPEDTTVPKQTVRLRRGARVEKLRQEGYTVIDWDPTRPLSVCCEQQTVPGGSR
ncbi:DUF58 domain-containing protein [Halovenus halobia]|uniref:DUF58 domain-containing protein n=1 Tax=Halovenus halobia TaxID=3396622 RepID=UPI003F54DDD5